MKIKKIEPIKYVKTGIFDLATFIIAMGIWGVLIWCIVQIHLFFSRNNTKTQV